MYKYIVLAGDKVIQGSNSKLDINKKYDELFEIYRERKLPSLKPSIYKLVKDE